MTKIRDKEHFLSQQRKVFAALKKESLSMLQAEKNTGVMRTNITWYLRNWIRDGLACIIKRDVDTLTGRKAKFFSTDLRTCKYCQGKLFHSNERRD